MSEFGSDKNVKNILYELRNNMAKADEENDNKAKAATISGIIEILLTESIQLEIREESMRDFNTSEIHALLAAA